MRWQHSKYVSIALVPSGLGNSARCAHISIQISNSLLALGKDGSKIEHLYTFNLSGLHRDQRIWV